MVEVMDTSSLHPTQVRLIDTVSTMLDSSTPYDILIEKVLNESGVSRGSLYYHFGDFPALVEQTLIIRFSQGVDESLRMMREALEQSASGEEFWQRMHALNDYAQNPDLAPRRAERARALGMAGGNERFADMLAMEQDRLTGEMTKLVEVAQEKGWVKKGLSPHAMALFIQAYTLGRALDDVADDKVDPSAWNELIMLVTSTLRG